MTKTTILMTSIIAMTFILLVTTSYAHAAVGDVVVSHNVDAIIDAVGHFCSIGLAFDGTDLYLDGCGDPVIYLADPLTGLPTGTILDAAIAEFPGAMAFDSSRNGLWIGGLSCNQLGMPIYFYDFVTGGPATLEFTIPFGLINPATGNTFVNICFTDGLAFNQNDPITGGDALYFSDDVTGELGIFTPAGVLVLGVDASLIDPTLATFSPGLSGLAIGGSNLYLGNNGGGQIFRAAVPGFAPLGQFASVDDRAEDMECDPVTFAQTVMWVRSTPQGNPLQNLVTAFEIEPDTCEIGGGVPDPTIEKFYTHTNNNWDRVCTEFEDIVQPDGTVVTVCVADRLANINDDDVFADNLDQNGEGEYVLLGKQNPKKTVVTPGQYIAVSNVFVPVEQDIWVEEDFAECVGDDNIGHVNPQSVPGGVQVVLVLANGDVIDIDDDLAAGIGGSIVLGPTSATVHVEDVPADSVLRVMVKFAPNHDPGMLGLECTNIERLLDDSVPPIVIAEATADLIIEAK